LNLVSNAIKFTPEGGAVTVRASRVKDWVEIAVIDTGIGIAHADFGLLFGEFQQLPQGAGGKQEGTGLGLALTKRFATLHGGDVTVASEVGKGSTFTIRLPVPSKPPPRSAPHTPEVSRSVDPSRPVVLVVEDSPQAAGIVSRHLEG